MELVEGQTLARLVSPEQTFAPQRVVEIINGLGAAVDYLHRAGLVHRDIKAPNVMLDEAGQAVLMDFGISRSLDSTQLTQTGMSLGTPQYMAPEQVRGDPAGPPADIYALGILAYHLLAGRPPFLGDTARVLYAQAHEPPPPLRDSRPGLPEHMYAAIDAALAKDPEARPASAGAFAAVLAGTAAVAPPAETAPAAARTVPGSNAPRPESTTQTRRSHKPAAIAGGLVAALVAGGAVAAVLLTRGSSSHAPKSPPTVAAAAVTTAPSATAIPAARAAVISQPAAQAGTSASPRSGSLVATPIAFPATIATFAGSGQKGFADGAAAAAQFNFPSGVAVDAAGNIYVADRDNNRIRKVAADGTVTTLAGTGERAFANGPATASKFNAPNSVAVDPAGNVYVADRGNNHIRKITPDGTVSTFAGSSQPGFSEGTGVGARFSSPAGITIDTAGNIYVSDNGNYRIRKVTPAGVVSTVAGSGTKGFADGPAASAQFAGVNGIAVDNAGNLYVADATNNRIRKVTPAREVSTFAGSGDAGFADGPAAGARFASPFGVAVDRAGNVYVADAAGSRIRRIGTDGIVSTLGGSGSGGFADGPGIASRFAGPEGLAVDAAGTIYVADSANQRIRTIKLQR
jgi:sugar lactone lactonase YvrE